MESNSNICANDSSRLCSGKYPEFVPTFLVCGSKICKLEKIGHDWGFYVMVTDLPKYMADVLRFSISQNGLYSSLPYLLMWIVSISTGFLSDWLIVRNHLSITNARKVFTAVGNENYICAYNPQRMYVNKLITFSRYRTCHFYYWCFIC